MKSSGFSVSRGPPLAGRVAKVTLHVHDLARSIGFYQRVLRLATSADSSDQTRCLSFAPRGALSDAIELIGRRPIGAVSAIDHFSIEAPTCDDVDGIYERALLEQARATPPRTSKGCLRRCVIFDPDGHKIEVFARRG